MFTVHCSFANYIVVSGLLLVLKDVNMINKGFKEGFFLYGIGMFCSLCLS